MKQIVFFLIFSVLVLNARTQDSLTLNLSNQYKQQVEGAVITINNVNYVSGKQGTITIPATMADSITIS